jgi:hypothetical protein
MKNYHVIYTDETGVVTSGFVEFIDFDSCEEWLKSIHAVYWEIGLPEWDEIDTKRRQTESDMHNDTDCCGNCFSDADPGL